MKVQLIRHATLIILINGKKLLVDPLLSKAGAMIPIENVPNTNFNPLVELPVSVEHIIDCDAVIITHTHRDHFDDEAAKLLPKDKPIICQVQDEAKLQAYGFTNVHPVANSYTWNDISFYHTDGKHGYGEIADKMAPVSGFIIQASKEPSIYIAGDTVWCEEVEEALENFTPDIVVCNCGAAQFHFGKPITMTAEDIKELCTRHKNIQVVAVHMEAWNHCRLSRRDLKNYIKAEKINNSIFIPEDGETLSF